MEPTGILTAGFAGLGFQEILLIAVVAVLLFGGKKIGELLNHNIETVPRMYPAARRGSYFERSLRLLAKSREIAPAITTKSGLMLGLGETFEESCAVLGDLASVGVSIVTIGQYLRPSGDQLPVARFYTPEEFAALKREGMRLGIRHVESGPLVRSSYHAHEQTTSLTRS